MVLTIHHLHASQSERLPWLCEELSIPYELKTYRRAPYLAPPEYKALHPAGTSPVLQDGDLTLAESGACVEYIAHVYGGGRLFVPPPARAVLTGPDTGPGTSSNTSSGSDSGTTSGSASETISGTTPDKHPYPTFLYWYHWANSTFQPAIGRSLAAKSANLPPESGPAKLAAERLHRSLTALEARLSTSHYLAGPCLTAADIMVVFSLTTMRQFYAYSLAEQPAIVAYLRRIAERPAYRRAMQRCDPDMELAIGADPPAPFAGG